MSRFVSGAIAGLWLSSCVGGNAFPCEVTSECVDGGRIGVCQADGWCSFPDAGCTSGQRYGEHAGDGLAGLCVGDEGTTGPGGDGTPVESSSDGVDPTNATLDASGPAVDDGETTSDGDAPDTMGASATMTTSASTSGPTDPSDEGEATTDDPTGPIEPVCGNGEIEGAEACDGTNVADQSCESIMMGTTGALACTAQCQLDTSACVPVPDGEYLPCDVDDECPAGVCHLFAGNGTCLPPCVNDNNCPDLVGADAAPFCSDGSFCLVPCMGDDTCPLGMRCDDSVYGLVCLF